MKNKGSNIKNHCVEKEEEGVGVASSKKNPKHTFLDVYLQAFGEQGCVNLLSILAGQVNK